MLQNEYECGSDNRFDKKKNKQDSQANESGCLDVGKKKGIYKLQGLLIRVLNCLYTIIFKRIPQDIRLFIILIILCGFFTYFIVFRSASMYNMMLSKKDASQTVGSFFLILIALLSMNREIEKVGWRKTMYIPYFLFAIGIIITGVIHPIGDGYMSFGLMHIVVYPCLYLVWNNRKDYEVLFNLVSLACAITGTAYFFRYAFLVMTKTDVIKNGRHSGDLYNANFLSFLGLVTSCACLYLLYYCFRRESLRRFGVIGYCLICITVSIIMVIDGSSRSAILIITINILCVLFFTVKNGFYNSRQRRLKKSTRTAIFTTAVLIFLIVGLMIPEMSILERFNFEDKTLDQFFSGRLRIWNNYWSDLNLLGHDMNEVNWNILTAGINTRHAHNNFLEYSYRCGVLVGAINIVFQFIAGIYALAIMFLKRVNRDYEVFIIIFMVHHTILSLIDISTVPLGSYGPFFFYICIAPLFVKEEKRQKKRDVIIET